MKKISLLALGLVTALATFAQDNWKVSLNGKNVLIATEESEEKNKLTIKKADLVKKKDFFLTYTEKPKQVEWEREIMIVGDNDHELWRQTTTKLKITNASLLSYFKKSNTLKIYSVSLPKDPAKKAAIRVRRVHLCTLTLKS